MAFAFIKRLLCAAIFFDHVLTSQNQLATFAAMKSVHGIMEEIDQRILRAFPPGTPAKVQHMFTDLRNLSDQVRANTRLLDNLVAHICPNLLPPDHPHYRESP